MRGIMNRSQILLLTLLCFGLSSCGLTGLDNYREAQKRISSLKENVETSKKEKVSQSIISLKEQIAKNWYSPINNNELKYIRVIMHLVLDKDGTVKELNIKDVICSTNSEWACQAIAESTVKAVRRGSPYRLPLAEYQEWKEVNILFDPRPL